MSGWSYSAIAQAAADGKAAGLAIPRGMRPEQIADICHIGSLEVSQRGSVIFFAKENPRQHKASGDYKKRIIP